VTATVAIADTEEARERVYEFRYRIYVDELGLRPAEADHANRRLSDALDACSVAYAVFDEDRVVGSLRLVYLAEVPDRGPLIRKFAMEPALDAFGAPAICTTSRFMLDPALRHGTVILRLMETVFEDARSRGIRLNYGDCSPHMLPFYEMLGYRRYIAPYNDTSYGYKIPILMLCDHDWFQRVRSPLRRVVQRHPDDPEARAWFERTYPDHVGIESAQLLPEDMYFEILASRVARDPLHHLSVLHGLDREEAALFLRESTILRAQAGDRIVRQGERDNTLFALLSGIAEVTLEGRKHPVAVLGAGDTFGEMGFLTTEPRTANVTARADSDVLVLSGNVLKRLVADHPTVAAKVLLNLSRILSGRLAVTTQAQAA
jgi:CRP-like cAMP-binding protein/GNAT superfamily N-acetyltransferase